MKRFLAICGLAGLAAIAAAQPAWADFFNLDGRFQCLERGDAVCGDPRPVPRPIIAAKPPAPATVPMVAAPVAPMPVSVAPSPPPAAAPVESPLHRIAARVATGEVASGDLVWLKQASESGNSRAIELLAWCKLNAIGTARDSVEAYLLYGAAAEAGLPHARENQTLIYENDLDSDQRQQVLDLVNEGVALARLSPRAQ